MYIWNFKLYIYIINTSLISIIVDGAENFNKLVKLRDININKTTKNCTLYRKKLCENFILTFNFQFTISFSFLFFIKENFYFTILVLDIELNHQWFLLQMTYIRFRVVIYMWHKSCSRTVVVETCCTCPLI